MEMMESTPSTIAPLLLRNLVTSIFVHADRPLVHLSQNYKLLQLLHSFIISTFLFFLSLLPSFVSALTPSHDSPHNSTNDDHYSPPLGRRRRGGGRGGSAASRALYQILLIMSDIPVSSRKYEVVRSLAEKLIDENLSAGNRVLREVNCEALSAAFSRSLGQLESAVVEQERWGMGGGEAVAGPVVRERDSLIYEMANLVAKGFGYFGRAAWRYAVAGSSAERSGSSAEKLAAELLWLAEKMAASGCIEEAVCKWASASNLAMLALSAEPRLQGSLVKASVFLIEEAKRLGNEEEEDDGTIRKWKMKILTSWLPLLCCATNGTDAPILTTSERLEMERTLEEIIGTLDAEEQEWVLSHWLHHFTHSPSSDWPNLRSSYTRWYNASRRRLLTSATSPATL